MAQLHFRTPPRVRVRATVKLSAAFLHEKGGGVRKGRGGGGYKSAIAPKIPALSVFKSEFKLSKFPSLSWIVSKYNCNAISQGQLLEMANTIIEFLTILQVSCDYDLTIYTLVMALILRKNNKKTQKY